MKLVLLIATVLLVIGSATSRLMNISPNTIVYNDTTILEEVKMVEKNNETAASEVMAFIAEMETGGEWGKLKSNPFALHNELYTITELQKMQSSDPRRFNRVIKSTARGHFGMIAGAMYDAVVTKKSVEWDEESLTFLHSVVDLMDKNNPGLGKLPVMSVELAILYLRHAYANKSVYSRSTFLTNSQKKVLEEMKRTSDYTGLWLFASQNLALTYSIWHKNPNAKDRYVLANSQLARIAKFDHIINKKGS